MDFTTAAEKQHSKGKLYVTERIDLLFDEREYRELTTEQNRDGVYICLGKVNGKTAVVAAQDFSFKGGTVGLQHGRNIAMGLDVAMKKRCPFISLNDSGGARIQEGIDSLTGYGDIFFRNTSVSGVIPQISVILGPCAGGAVYSPGIMDFVFVVDQVSQMFITGPKVVKAVMGETVTAEELGGAAVHAQKSGVAHVRCADEQACFESIRTLIALLPGSNRPRRIKLSPDMEPKAISFRFPERMQQGYDVKMLIRDIFDEGSFFELQEEFARSIVVGFAALGGQTVGVIANQPMVMAGILDCDSSDKAARFVRFCDAFSIPMVTLTDVPGYLPGLVQEHAGIIRHGAKLLYAFSESTVPRINVILRKAYGGAYIAMNSLPIGADYVFAVKGGEVAVIGEHGAVEIIYAKEAASLPPAEKTAFLNEKAREYRQTTMNTELGLKHGYIHEEIELSEIREKLIKRFSVLKRKKRVAPRKRHGNIPL